jgi:hypothetical protein
MFSPRIGHSWSKSGWPVSLRVEGECIGVAREGFDPPEPYYLPMTVKLPRQIIAIISRGVIMRQQIGQELRLDIGTAALTRLLYAVYGGVGLTVSADKEQVFVVFFSGEAIPVP